MDKVTQFAYAVQADNTDLAATLLAEAANGGACQVRDFVESARKVDRLVRMEIDMDETKEKISVSRLSGHLFDHVTSITLDRCHREQAVPALNDVEKT